MKQFTTHSESTTRSQFTTGSTFGMVVSFVDGPKVTDGAKTQLFAANRRLSQIHPFCWKFKNLEGAENHRPSQKTEHLNFVSAPVQGRQQQQD